MNSDLQQRIQALFQDPVQSNRWRNPSFDNSDLRAWLNIYQAHQVKYYADADLDGVDDAELQINKTSMALTQIYVDEQFSRQDLSHAESSEDFEKKLQAANPQSILDLLIREQGKDLSVSNKLILIGAPGSGKSSLVRMLAYSCANWQKSTPYRDYLGRRLVLPFILRELSLDGVKTSEDLLKAWAKHISRQAGNPQLIDLTALKTYLSQGWAILAFDGVDEIGGCHRQQLRNWIYALAARYPACAMLITGRPVGFAQGEFAPPRSKEWQALKKTEQLSASPPAAFAKQYLCPFNDAQIEQYIQRWYQARHPKNRVQQKQEAEELVAEIHQQQALRALKRRPIYLATLVYVHDFKGRLPNSQVRAYGQMVEAYLSLLDAKRRQAQSLLDTEQNAIVCPLFDFDDKRRILEQLSHDLHYQQLGIEEKDRLGDKRPFNTLLSVEDFKNWLQHWLEQADCQLKLRKSDYLPLKQQGREQELLDSLLYYFTARAGLLVQPDEAHLMFSHLSFQEYLTGVWLFRDLANHAFDAPQFLQEKLLDKLSQRDEWFPVGLAFFGYQTQEQGGSWQQQLLQHTWVKEGTPPDAEQQPRQFRFLHKLISEGEPSFNEDFKLKLWAFYWQAAAANLNHKWIGAFAEVSWPAQAIKDWLAQRFAQLQGQQAVNDLVLYSMLPEAWLEAYWQNLDLAELQTRYSEIKAFDDLFFALDLHAMQPVVREFLSPVLSLEQTLLLANGGTSWDEFLVLPWAQLRAEPQLLSAYQHWLSAELSPPPCLFGGKGERSLKVFFRAAEKAAEENKALALALALDRDRALDLALARVLDLEQALYLDRALARARTLSWAQTLDWALDWALVRALNWTLDWARDQHLDLELDLALDLALPKAFWTYVSVWTLSLSNLQLSPYCFATPQAALQALEQSAEVVPGFADLFDKDWFPYQALQAQAVTGDYRVEPIEALTHRFYRLLRHLLAEVGEDIRDLPEYLKDLPPASLLRKFHGDEAADQYLADLSAAGWQPPAPGKRWIPEAVDQWVIDLPNTPTWAEIRAEVEQERSAS